MIYLDNIIFSLQKHGGVSVLWGKLIERLIASKLDIKLLEYRGCALNKVRESLNIPSTIDIHQNNLPINLIRYFNPSLKYSDQFIFHSSHYRVCNNVNAKNITTVHDFTYELFFKGLRKHLHIWQKYNAIRKSDVIICISNNTKRDLLKFLPDIPENKIRVIYNGVSDDYYRTNCIFPEYSEDILFVGGRQSYKNFRFAVSCAKEIGKRLIIAGGGLSEEEEKLLNRELGQNGYVSVKHPDNVTLNAIYNSCCMLFYPSLYEGFGIPVVEAQKAGCPVIAMNASSIPEIIGHEGLMLNSSTISEFKKKYEILSVNRDYIIDAGMANASRFSWDNMTWEYLNLYKEVGNNVL